MADRASMLVVELSALAGEQLAIVGTAQPRVSARLEIAVVAAVAAAIVVTITGAIAIATLGGAAAASVVALPRQQVQSLAECGHEAIQNGERPSESDSPDSAHHPTPPNGIPRQRSLYVSLTRIVRKSKHNAEQYLPRMGFSHPPVFDIATPLSTSVIPLLIISTLDPAMPCLARYCRLLIVCPVLLAPAIATAQAPSTAAEEIREYDVLVKQAPSGKVVTRMFQSQDGSTVATTDTTVDARFFLMKYHYEYHGKETWQGDRLVRLESHADDDGKKLAVAAAVDASGSRFEAQGKPARSGPVLAMTSTYWRLPDLRLAAGNFAILDSDTGTLFNVRLQRVGPELVAVNGRNVACEHYRISGDTAAELWFDGERRLVRQQTVEQGYVTELRLVRITAIAAKP